jgi:hypothetical protein
VRSAFRAVAFGALLGTLQVCVRATSPPLAPDQLSLEDSLKVLVLQHRLVAPRPGRVRLACIAVASSDSQGRRGALHDPSPAFLAHLAKGLNQDSLALRVRSACRRHPDARQPQGGVSEIATGAPAIDEWVSSVVWQGTDRAEVESGNWCGSLCAAEYRCVIERAGGTWRVRTCVLHRISSRPERRSTFRSGAAELPVATGRRDVQGIHHSSPP